MHSPSSAAAATSDITNPHLGRVFAMLQPIRGRAILHLRSQLQLRPSHPKRWLPLLGRPRSPPILRPPIVRIEVPKRRRVEVQVFGGTMAEILGKSLTLEEGLQRGFEVVYDANIETACARCEGSGGICGSDSSEFVCHCRDRTDPATCQRPGDGWNAGRKLVIGENANRSSGTHFLRTVRSLDHFQDEDS
ncbi:hypothetical protein RHGRI_034669 [Rhododendron griersonianum]|uniref:Wall-associated receptor kinase C-terminal domain-containing protein n=1 Tax=Rhododendron griersonianum TaxID=479676 RepID=A0AAV6I1X6_9ERIC|nr:hypothetical protein RHGRI_034669 [Rhododendron griersonianum]